MTAPRYISTPFCIWVSTPAAYDDVRSRDEAPTGTEPALQGLLNWLPADPTAPPLPAYSATPEALSPLHCRLCLADCSGVLPAG